MFRRTLASRYRNPQGSGWTQPQLQGTEHGVYGAGRGQMNDPRLARRKGETGYAHVERLVRNHTFDYKDADDAVFGGNHASAKAAAMNELKNFDKRLATPFHPELTMNVLKCASFYTTPHGTMFTNDFLEGRLVGICMASDTMRSNAFLPILARFSQQHEGDFVPVVISMGKDEMEEQAHALGLNYLSHFRGSMLVKRDLGHNTGRWLPLPRVIVVDGDTGFPITHSGYTGIRVRPETCFNAWLNGDSGLSLTDYPLAWWTGSSPTSTHDNAQ